MVRRGRWRPHVSLVSIPSSCSSGDAVQNVMAISTDGKVLRKFDLGLEQSSGAIVGSRDGRRYAVPTMRWGVGRNNPDVIHARVFSLDSDAPILTLDVSHLTNGGSDFLLALGTLGLGGAPCALAPTDFCSRLNPAELFGCTRCQLREVFRNLKWSQSRRRPALPPDLPKASPTRGSAQPPSPLVEQVLLLAARGHRIGGRRKRPLPVPQSAAGR